MFMIKFGPMNKDANGNEVKVQNTKIIFEVQSKRPRV